ncbi:MAG: site-specific DNA-methyltransferase [Planctomycetes bacterium]|nr:site-specific DNA-methyltransferase [Planctomycetota bacterium]
MAVKPYYETEHGKIYLGHVLDILKQLPVESVQCCVTSPPYWGLRDYDLPPMIWNGDKFCEHVWGDDCPGDPRGGSGPNAKEFYAGDGETTYARQVPRGNFCQQCGAWKGCLGLEPTPELYVKHIVEIFRQVRRVLRKDGTLWLNLGDSYWGGKGQNNYRWSAENTDRDTLQKPQHNICANYGEKRPQDGTHNILKPKDLIGIPWRVALALQQDGWWLRQDIIWSKPNPMPESVTDRCTKAHEYVFLLTKSAKYFYDAEAIKEDGIYGYTPKPGMYERVGNSDKNPQKTFGSCKDGDGGKRNKRSVWTIPTQPMPEAHFATFPQKLIEPCVLSGCPENGIVLDLFFGSGTVGIVAYKHNRKFIGIDLSENYLKSIAIPRIEKETKQLKWC